MLDKCYRAAVYEYFTMRLLSSLHGPGDYQVRKNTFILHNACSSLCLWSATAQVSLLALLQLAESFILPEVSTTNPDIWVSLLLC